MYDFVSHVLKRYFEATGWNEHNSYLYLNAASSALLDFPTPPGVAFSISASPSPPFFTTYRLRALPTLQGNVGYVFASTEGEEGVRLDIGQSSGHISLQRMVERFRVFDLPVAPQGKEEVWQGGRRIDKRDYLLYGSVHIPSSRVDALYTCRISPSWQAILSASSTPPRVPFAQQIAQLAGLNSDHDGGYSMNAFKPTPTNLQVLLQRDTGKWSTECSYSLDDALWGFRFLHNFGNRTSVDAPVKREEEHEGPAPADGLRKQPEDWSISAGGGLKGRFSAGAEIFFSSVEKSAGLSTGMRFSTLPDANPIPGVPPSQPPTVITATLNPMMGHLSMAYAARMSRDVAACSRYDFNVYSYDSELTFGFEYWLRAASAPTTASVRASQPTEADALDKPVQVRSLVAVAPEWSLRENASLSAPFTKGETPAASNLRDGPSHQDEVRNTALEALQTLSAPQKGALSGIIGLVKARISSTMDISLMWEGRLRNSLISAGCRGNLHNRARPVSSIGLEIMYFSSAADVTDAAIG